VFSAVPQIINYQGSLSDSSGSPVNATLSITFTLYDVASGPGVTLWQETQSVEVTNGVFNVQLGADTVGNPLNATILDDPIYLGVQVDADAEMTPRQRVTSAAFAIRSQTVEVDTLNSLACSEGEVPKLTAGSWACGADDEGVGDITGVTTSNGITGGGTSGDIDIGADRNVLQARVSGSCPAGQSIRVIDDNGTVTCEVDTDTTYAAGSGLTLGGTTFSIRSNGVENIHLAPNSVGTSEVQDNSLAAKDLAPNSVETSEIADGAVEIDDLNNNAKGFGINGSIIIPAAEFQPVNSSAKYSLGFNGFIFPTDVSSIICLVAPVNIPHGVTISRFEISVWDNSAVNNITFDLERIAFSTGVEEPMGTVISAGSLASIRVFSDTTILNGAVNGFDYTYQITGCVSSDAISSINLRLHGARIRYN